METCSTSPFTEAAEATARRRLTGRWVVIGLALAAGETLASVMMSLLLVKFGRGWDAAVLLAIGVGSYLAASVTGYLLLRAAARSLEGPGARALSAGQWRFWGPLFLTPFLALAAILWGAPPAQHPFLIAIVFLTAAPIWYAALAVRVLIAWMEIRFLQPTEIIRLIPAELDVLPPLMQHYLEERGADFEALGFDDIGSFLQKPKAGQYCRLFHGAGGKFVGEVIVSESAGTKSCCIYTLLENGTFVESAITSLGGPPPESRQIILTGNAGRTVGELLQTHGEVVHRICGEQDTAPVALEASQLELVSRYGVYLCVEDLRHRGVVSENGYAPLREEIMAGIHELLQEPVAV